MSTLTAQNLGWVAAIIDFKGKISRKATQGRVTPLLVLRVDTTNLKVAQELSRLTGVSVQPRDARLKDEWERRGCAEHCPEPHIHAAYDMHQMGNWRVAGAAAAIVLYNVLPYMVTDEKMSATMEEILENTELRGRRGNSARQAVERLAALGWKLPPSIREQRRVLQREEKRAAA